MANITGISWTDTTWNPVVGCTKLTTECKNCYMFPLAKRLQAAGIDAYRHGSKLTLNPAVIAKPFSWRKPRMVFVNSMSDLFHSDVPDWYIQQVFEVMNRCDKHIFQVLTKRTERLKEIAPRLTWSPNIWMGVSVGIRASTFRIDDLRAVPAEIRFISAEPLLEDLGELNLEGIHWLIAGGESGHKHRPMDGSWALSLRDQCATAKTAFFFKQWGGRTSKAGGKLLDGREHCAFPQL